MTPGQARKEALSVLRATRRKMMSSSWNRALKNKDMATKKRAAHNMLNIGSAIDTIELAELDSIAGAMEDNEKGIEAAIDDLRAAIENMNKVNTVLNAVEKLLALGDRILPLLI